MIAASREKIDVAAIPKDEKLRTRVLHMPAAEAVERLGAHVYNANVSFEWTARGRTTRLNETRTLTSDKGGLSGDFALGVENSRDQGLEVHRIKTVVYARSRYGPFRQRLRDRGMAEREREELYGALRDLDLLVGERLKLTSRGKGRYDGREVIDFTVSLGPPAKEGFLAEQKTLVPLELAKKGADPATTRRFNFSSKRQPRSVEGGLRVDVETGVVLKADLVANLTAPAPSKESDEASLQLKLESEVRRIGVPPKLARPAAFLLDGDKPVGIADALDRFGIPRGEKSDAGTASPTPEDDEG